MRITFEKIIKNKEEMLNIDKTNPYNVAALLVHTICNYDINDTNNFYDMLTYLMGDMQPISALMKQKVIYIFSHDSIEVGEDGPTHQPIEQLDALRQIPNLQVFRPACGSEVGFAYKQAYMYDGPTAIVLSKNKLPILTAKQKDMEKGAYLITKAKKPIANIFATGLEVGFALKVIEELQAKGQEANLISIVNKKIFDKYDYRLCGF